VSCVWRIQLAGKHWIPWCLTFLWSVVSCVNVTMQCCFGYWCFLWICDFCAPRNLWKIQYAVMLSMWLSVHLCICNWPASQRDNRPAIVLLVNSAGYISAKLINTISRSNILVCLCVCLLTRVSEIVTATTKSLIILHTVTYWKTLFKNRKVCHVTLTHFSQFLSVIVIYVHVTCFVGIHHTALPASWVS